MSQILTHRLSNKVYEWKVTPNGHYMLRQLYLGCSGLKPTKWKRVLSAEVKQLVNESIEYGSEKVKQMQDKPLINVAKLGHAKQKCSCWWGIGLVLFAAGCIVALYFGLVMRGWL